MAISWHYINDYLAIGVDWCATTSDGSVALAPKVYRWDSLRTDNYGGSFDEYLSPDPSGAGAWYDLDFGSGSGSRCIDTFATRTYTKTHSAQTVSLKIAWENIGSYYSGSFHSLGSGSKTWTYTVPAKPSYSVAFNANSGTGAPSSQTKWYGESLTLSSTKPTRTGYTFKNWNTASGGTGTSYSAGGTVAASTNSNLTLYAQWTANTYTISFNANGGSGAPSSVTKTYGETLTLPTTVPTRTNYNFLGWATSASATTATYAAGGTVAASALNAATTLYAVWELAYTKPVITSLEANRCDSDGTLNDFGLYAKVTFKWSVCTIISGVSVSSVKVTCNGTTTSVSASGTSGSVSQVVGAGALSIESQYAITATVTDSKSGSATSSTTLATAAFTLDFLAGGGGVAFGKAADYEGLECAYPAKFTVESGTSILVEHGKASTGAFIRAKRSDTGASVGFGVGSGGINRGLYDITGGHWIAYSDSTHPLYTKIPNLYITGTTDASGTADNNAPLIIGNRAGQHIVIDGNEIISKSSGTATGTLYLGESGSTVIASPCKTSTTYPMYGARVLYSNSSGTTGTVTLSETAANFTFLEIYWKTNDNESGSTKVYLPNGKYVTLFHNKPRASDQLTIKTRQVYISGTSVANSTANASLAYYSMYLYDSEVINSDATVNCIYITYIIGYK